MSFMFETITDFRLDIPPEIHQASWEDVQSVSYPSAKWSRYLNDICSKTVLPWLQEEQTPTATLSPYASPALWELVSGTVIHLGSKRLVLIPDKTLDVSELRVPQEWVDIPAWAGDYFLAVQIDPDDLWLRVWGYTTHEQIKQLGHYDDRDRSYGIEAEHLVQDLSVLWVVQQLYPNEPTQAEVLALPALSATQAEELLLQLSQPTILQPRLEAPFEQWGALLNNDNLRQRLLELRQNLSTAQTCPTPLITSLGQWLHNQFDAGWEALESLLGVEPDLAFNVRQTTDLNEPAVRRAKLLRFPDHPVLLLVAIEPEADGRFSVRVQVRPTERSQCLPQNLSLTLLVPSGERIQSVQAREQDNLIQLKRFKCPSGARFSLEVLFAETLYMEEFVV
ncbi:MAG: DUF1822 family protein [Oscillatoriales cyanobacterium C42_A2020_001]|nr:DUF1822 family protein [Leptolyngbyaceae cyanobacterium C42_A2020_001]